MADETDYTRTFVGARYVPKFVDYSATAVYEPLTMVVVNDNIYISKQFVPSGIQIDNTDYWSMMPAFDTNSQTAITNAVNAWLDNHPEATTTVQDGSITKIKLNDEIFNTFVSIDGYKQVTEKNTTFFSIGQNKFNKNDVEDNTQLNQNGVGTHAQENFSTTDYINVSDLNSISFYRENAAGTAFVSESAYYVLFDNDKNNIGTRQLANTVDVSSVAYIRLSISSDNKNSFICCDSDISVTNYIPFGYTFNYSDEPDTVFINPEDNILEKLINNKGKNIYFNAGNYDIINIFTTYFGSDFFDNYSGYSENALYRGIPVYRETTMKFSPNAKFVANYTGNNISVKQHFSAFALEGGVTFDGLNIVATGIRNIIHDDFDNSFIGTTTIKNCHLVNDNIVIAGGLALHELVEIYNNYFERTDATTHIFDISYHQNGINGAQSEMIIKDNYCSKGISIRYYGSSPLITDCLISNNSVAYDIEYRAENSTATIENMRVLKWNNYIRS